MTHSSAPDTTPARSRYHHGDLRRTLCRAAATLIEAGEPLTLRAAAMACGVSPAAPYRHFKDRADLLAAVLTEGFRELARATESARLAESDPWLAVQGVGTSYVRFACGHPRIYKLMFGSECDKAAHPQLLAAGQEAFDVLLRAVADCLAEQGGDRAAIELVAVAGWSLAHGVASLHVDGHLDQMALDTLAPALMQLLVDGVRSQIATPTSSRSRPRRASDRSRGRRQAAD